MSTFCIAASVEKPEPKEPRGVSADLALHRRVPQCTHATLLISCVLIYRRMV